MADLNYKPVLFLAAGAAVAYALSQGGGPDPGPSRHTGYRAQYGQAVRKSAARKWSFANQVPGGADVVSGGRFLGSTQLIQSGKKAGRWAWQAAGRSGTSKTRRAAGSAIMSANNLSFREPPELPPFMRPLTRRGPFRARALPGMLNKGR